MHCFFVYYWVIRFLICFHKFIFVLFVFAFFILLVVIRIFHLFAFFFLFFCQYGLVFHFELNFVHLCACFRFSLVCFTVFRACLYFFDVFIVFLRTLFCFQFFVCFTPKDTNIYHGLRNSILGAPNFLRVSESIAPEYFFEAVSQHPLHV